MSPRQLRLFAPAKPLLARFGAAFFRAAPPKPGVYIMAGEAGRILYIGQSKNLRHRLGAYKNARPDQVSRKIIRLVHSVRSIVWEECATPIAARLKENQLLRTHRPWFNVQNTYPQAYRFISLRADVHGMTLALGHEPKPGEKIYGAFKGGSSRAFGALLRLLWAVVHQPTSPHDFPAPLLRPKPPRDYCFLHAQISTSPHSDRWVELLENFLGGSSAELVLRLAENLPAGETISPFQSRFQTSDIEVLTTFFEHGPRRNHNLSRQAGLAGGFIPRENLDDLLVSAEKDSVTAPRA